MSRRNVVLWTLSGVLLGWIVLLTVHSHYADGCRAAGGRWDWRRWHCRPAPAIELRRELQRG